MTSQLRWVLTLFIGIGIVGFVFLNYQDPWPPLVPRPLDPNAVETPLLPPTDYPLDEGAALDSDAAGGPEVVPPEVPPVPAPSRAVSESAAAPAPRAPDADLQRLFATATQLLESARLQPLYDDGALLGVRIASVERESFLARFGLQSGDVVRSVNDLRLDDPNAAAVLAAQIAAGSPLDVDVEREDGTPVRLSIPVRDLLAEATTRGATEAQAPQAGSPAPP